MTIREMSKLGGSRHDECTFSTRVGSEDMESLALPPGTAEGCSIGSSETASAAAVAATTTIPSTTTTTASAVACHLSETWVDILLRVL
jgi:hypothetical protein